MSLLPNQFYHVYNQGNNKGRIFFKKANYDFFLQRYEKHIAPYCKTVAYCLMPNHFHFLLCTTDISVQKKKVGGNMSFLLKEGYRQLLSSYTMAINPQENRSGSLFRQRTKFKSLNEGNNHYPMICFNYIHQNPLKAGLVNRMEDYEFSSYKEYLHKNTGICDQSLAYRYLNICEKNFQEQSYGVIFYKF